MGSPVVTENANEGTDLVNVAIASLWSGTYTLAENIENATIASSVKIMNDINFTVAYNLVGNDLNNVLKGNSAKNTLDGAKGNDTMTGGLGNDSFNFSSALSATNIDTISDFLSGTDKIALRSSIFTKLLNDTNLLDNLVVGGIGAKAIDANDYLIYNSFSKGLFYDADGSGAGTAVQFATLNNVSTLNANDFVVI